MPTRSLRTLLATLVLAAAVAACGDDDDDDDIVFPQFRATLSGANEVPPRTTNASGSFTLTDRGTAGMNFDLTVNNATNITAAHIHLGPAGVNGGVIVPLFGGDTIASQNGRLASGTITQASIVGLSGAAPITMDSLRALMRSGNAYVNVHSTTFPGGEIRGQITRTN